MIEPKARCTKCGAVILEVTARHHKGRCAQCCSRRRRAEVKEFLLHLLMMPFYMLAMPFVLAWEMFRWVRRRWTFPFAISELRERVRPMFKSRRDAHLYLHGVVDGYYRHGGQWMLPPDPRDLAHYAGLKDGAALGEGRLLFSDLPTRDEFFIQHLVVAEKTMPGV